MRVLEGWGASSLSVFLLITRVDCLMAASLAMKGCMAVWTAAVSVTISRGIARGTGGSAIFGVKGDSAGCAGCGAEPDTVRFPPAEGVGREGRVVENARCQA